MRFLLLRPSTHAYRGLLDSELRSLLVSSRVFDDFSKHLSKQPSLEGFKIKEYINQKIQLLEKNNLINKSRLENIKEKIKILKEPKFNQDTSLVASHAKQLFFNAKTERGNSTVELKNQDQESYKSNLRV